MIGSSLPLCYPQIGAPNLFFPRAHVPCLPLDKTYPTGLAPKKRSLIGIKLKTARFQTQALYQELII